MTTDRDIRTPDRRRWAPGRAGNPSDPVGAAHDGATDRNPADEPASIRPGAMLPGGGGWLRIILAIATLLTMFELWVPGQAGGQVFLQLVLMIGVGLWLVVRPGSAAPVILLIAALALRIFLGKAELDASLIALVFLLPLIHQLAALAAVIPVRSNVSWSALLPTAVRYLAAVLVTVVGLVISHAAGAW